MSPPVGKLSIPLQKAGMLQVKGLGLGRGTPGRKSGKGKGAEAREQSKLKKFGPVLSIPRLLLSAGCGWKCLLAYPILGKVIPLDLELWHSLFA